MSGFEKQTYTQIPNSLFEIMNEMDECELKVVLYICRYTFGYHRDEVKISTRKLASAIKMSVASVDKGADAAVKRGLIERVVDGQNTTTWRAIVSDSEIESPVIQKLNHPDSEIESQVGVKERIKKEKKLGDLVDGTLEMAKFPGLKQQARIDAILSYIGGRLRINAETKRWKEFARFVDNEQKTKGWELSRFIDWLVSQPRFDIQYWTPEKMQVMYPQAFIEEQKPAKEMIRLL